MTWELAEQLARRFASDGAGCALPLLWEAAAGSERASSLYYKHLLIHLSKHTSFSMADTIMY